MTVSLVVRTSKQRQLRIGVPALGKIPADVSLGYGLLGTVHAGSSFSTEYEEEPGDEWKSSVVTTAIEGRVLLLKEIGRNEHTVHSEFKELPEGITVVQAVGVLLR
ncbi:MAG: hypothetical protein ABI286_08100 [Edaphobacter sp.]